LSVALDRVSVLLMNGAPQLHPLVLLSAGLTFLAAVLTSCTPSVDQDLDGSEASEDCDDTDARRRPGAEELCDGIDNDCDAVTWAEGEGEDYDGDGSLSCVDCDDQNPAIYPGAPALCEGVDADCDGSPDGEGEALGSSADCPAMDCSHLLEERPETTDGTYWIHAGEINHPFEVACDMSTEGGGWIHLALADSDGVIVASNSEGNPWYKCEDDAAAFYEGLTEDDLTADSLGSRLVDFPLSYIHPLSGSPVDPVGLDALRPILSELHSGSRMVATIGDNDGGSWQDGSDGGIEVYIVTATGDWLLLTPGSGGDCGGGSWPSSGSETGFYLWGSSSADAEVAGDTGLEAAEWSLGAGQVLPASVQLAIFTGGGASFGFEQPSFRVR
jgi:hypothetical protein